MSENIIEIKNLSTVYQSEEETVYAVNDISLSLEKGKTLGIVGETGAGKTTMALSIMKLLPQFTGKITSGSILFDGKDLVQLSNKEMRSVRGNRISMIFQDPMSALNPVLKVSRQIEEALKVHYEGKLSSEEIAIKVDNALEMVGIPSERRDDYPHQFSGGMKQRVVIAMALACEPELLIADEPTTALDVTVQAQVLAMMNELKERLGTSMIMITHDFGIVAQTCDTVAVMYAGEIVETGTLEDLFKPDAVHHPYTESLFAAIPKIHEKTKRLNPIDGLMPDPTDLPKGCKFSPRCKKCTEKCTRELPKKNWSATHMIACHLFE